MITFTDIYNCAFQRSPFILSQHIQEPISGIDVYMGTANDYQVIAIGPSVSVQDWVTDFEFIYDTYKYPSFLAPTLPVRAHGGYLDGWDRLRAQVLALLTPEQKIIVTGYSMGGGVSEIIALDLGVTLKPADLICIDWDGARVWNRAGQTLFNTVVPKAWKVAYSNDIVSKVVPWYYHGGTFVSIGPKRVWWKWSIQDHITAGESTIVPLLQSTTIV